MLFHVYSNVCLTLSGTVSSNRAIISSINLQEMSIHRSKMSSVSNWDFCENNTSWWCTFLGSSTVIGGSSRCWARQVWAEDCYLIQNHSGVLCSCETWQAWAEVCSLIQNWSGCWRWVLLSLSHVRFSQELSRTKIVLFPFLEEGYFFFLWSMVWQTGTYLFVSLTNLFASMTLLKTNFGWWGILFLVPNLIYLCGFQVISSAKCP